MANLNDKLVRQGNAVGQWVTMPTLFSKNSIMTKF